MRILVVIALSVSAFALPAVTATGGAAAETKKPRKLSAPSAIALGDIHGDYDTFRRLLLAAGLIDEDDHWNGRRQHLIQTGDIVDRGRDSRRALDLLMRLEKEAAAAGGRVVVTMGNHDLWNLIGRHEYVVKGEYAAFAGEEAPALREKKRRAILALVEKPHPLLRSRYYSNLAFDVNRRTFGELFPAGCFAHRAAFSPDGHYGKWLMKRPILHREHNILFVHGGIGPKYAHLTASTINREAPALLADYFTAVRALEALGVFDSGLGWETLVFLIEWERRAGPLHPKLAPHFGAIERFNASLLIEDEGPLMYRGLALGNERLLASTVERVLATHAVERIVIGHTQPRSLAIETRFSHRVVMIDTGLNQEVYKGRPSLLAVYPGGKLRIFSP